MVYNRDPLRGSCCKKRLQTPVTLGCNSPVFRCNRASCSWPLSHKADPPLPFPVPLLQSRQLACARAARAAAGGGTGRRVSDPSCARVPTSTAGVIFFGAPCELQTIYDKQGASVELAIWRVGN